MLDTAKYYVVVVAAGGTPAVELGILPGGHPWKTMMIRAFGGVAGRQDAALYGRRDACRYVFKTRV